MAKHARVNSRRSRDPIEVVRKDFHDAMDRILAGKPRDPVLKKQADRDALELNPSTLSREAKHSRTLIALKDCRLPDVRDRMLKASLGNEVVIPSSSAEVIARLRDELVLANREKDALRVQNVKLVVEIDDMSKEASKWRNAYKAEIADRGVASRVTRMKRPADQS